MKDEDRGWEGYVDSCLDSALKAYMCLEGDGHSGMSFSITRGILENLMHGIPLTPIEDVPESWSDITSGNPKHLQCIRRSSLFKDINEDGTASYHDIDNDVLDEVSMRDGHVSCLGSYRTTLTLKKYAPEALEITFPYCPPRFPWRVRMTSEITPSDQRQACYWDFCFLSYIKKPNGEYIDINKFVGFSSNSKKIEELSDRQAIEYGLSLTDEQIKWVQKK